MKVERQMKPTEGVAVIHHQAADRQIGLPDENAAIVFVQNFAHAGHQTMRLRLVGAVHTDE